MKKQILSREQIAQKYKLNLKFYWGRRKAEKLYRNQFKREYPYASVLRFN